MTDNDYIEKLIQNNLEELNENEPMQGHFARFEDKLKQQNKKKKINLKIVWRVAAAVVFIFLATNQAILYLSPERNADELISLASVSEEYEEVEFFYTNAINVGLGQWNSLKAEGFISAEEESMMNDELEEFETLYKNLQQDLTANPNDERVINAMLQYYQAKLSVINMIVEK